MVKRKFWTASEAMRTFTLCLMAFLLASFVPFLFVGAGAVTNPVLVWIVSGIATATLALVPAGLAEGKGVDFKRAVRLDRKPGVKQVLLGLGVVAGLIFFILPVVEWVVELLVKLGFPTPSGVDIGIGSPPLEIFLAVFVAGLIASVAEEIFARGVIAGGLAKLGKIKAALLSGFLFMIFHMNPANTIYQFVLGFVLGYFFLHTGSIWVAVIMHMFNNLFSIGLSLLLPQSWAVALFEEYVAITMIAGGAIAAACFWAFAKKTPDDYKSFIDREGIENAADIDKVKGADIAVLCLGVVICAAMWVFTLTNVA